MTEFANGWLSPRDLRPDARMRLFCLPHAGSGAAGYYRWKRLLPDWIDVCPVLLPGRENRLAEGAMTDLSVMIDRLHAATEGLLDVPYAIFGHSMGALIAFEWSRRIAASGVRLPTYLFVSGRNGANVASGPADLHRLSDEAFLEALSARYGGAQQEVLADPELRSVYLPILRADLALVESFRYRAGELLDCPVMAFAGHDDRSVSDEGLGGWSELTRASFAVERLEGDHFFHLGSGQSRLLEGIDRALSSKR